MEDFSRRIFVRRAGMGALAVGLVAGSPAIANAATSTAAAPAAAPVAAAPSTEPVVAHVVDASSGLVHVFVGTRMIAVTDHGLARSLSTIASR
jgi:hypothetical protein